MLDMPGAGSGITDIRGRPPRYNRFAALPNSRLIETRKTMLSADKVLVIVGTPCSMSAVGGTETYEAKVAGDEEFIALAAFDAGLIDYEKDAAANAFRRRWAQGPAKGDLASIEDIESRHGATLRSHLGIRQLAHLRSQLPGALDIAAPLPHDLESGGLRTLAGLRYEDIRASSLRDLHGLFDSDPRLGPSLQSQLFLYSGLGALAALPTPLATLLANPYEFRIVGATCFPALDMLSQWNAPRTSESQHKPRDRFAMQLASSLASHGPALLSTMLAPSYSISRVVKHPQLLQSLVAANGYMRVPQAPLTVTAACASSLVAFTSVAASMVFDYPGYQRPTLALWSAADAAVQADLGVVDAFGAGAMMTRAKLDEANTGRPLEQRRSIADSLAPFDVDAAGTVVGNAGTAAVVTTLDFALRNFLDITAIVVGWGQSGETGGKAHFAGVGFGGENAIIQAYEMAYRGHDYGVEEFDYFVAHATGTHTNSKSELAGMASARRAVAERQQFKGALPRMKVGATKAVGDGHSMGETGLKAVSQAVQYVLSRPAVALPTLVTPDPSLGATAQEFTLQRSPVEGNAEAGAICATQGFGGYDGAVALKAANPESLSRYAVDKKVLVAYLERWPQLRAEREQRERTWRRRRGGALELAQAHCWRGLESA